MDFKDAVIEDLRAQLNQRDEVNHRVTQLLKRADAQLDRYRESLEKVVELGRGPLKVSDSLDIMNTMYDVAGAALVASRQSCPCGVCAVCTAEMDASDEWDLCGYHGMYKGAHCPACSSKEAT